MLKIPLSKFIFSKLCRSSYTCLSFSLINRLTGPKLLASLLMNKRHFRTGHIHVHSETINIQMSLLWKFHTTTTTTLTFFISHYICHVHMRIYRYIILMLSVECGWGTYEGKAGASLGKMFRAANILTAGTPSLKTVAVYVSFKLIGN